MKYLKTYKESLENDFLSTTKDLKGEVNPEYQANKLKDLIKDKTLKKEFMYRLSDGENLYQLIEEFVDRIQLPENEDLQFRAIVRHYKIEELRKEYPSISMGLSFITLSIERGIDVIFNKLIKPLGELDNIKDILDDTIIYLEKTQELLNWVYKNIPSNPGTQNAEKIKAGKELIEMINKSGYTSLDI